MATLDAARKRAATALSRVFALGSVAVSYPAGIELRVAPVIPEEGIEDPGHEASLVGLEFGQQYPADTTWVAEMLSDDVPEVRALGASPEEAVEALCRRLAAMAQETALRLELEVRSLAFTDHDLDVAMDTES